MSITFFNVKTGEEKIVDTEPMIAAFFNSTDQHVNAMLGQDFGWRIAPETIKRIREIQADGQLMNRIATSFQLPLDGVGKTDVLRWISLEDARAEAKKNEQEQGDFTKEYEDKIRALDEPVEALPQKVDSNTQNDGVKMEEPKKANNNKEN